MTESDATLTVSGGSQNVPVTTVIPGLILIGQDTIHLRLKEFRERLAIQTKFASSAAVFLSCAPVVFTASGFNEFLLVPGYVWQALYTGIVLLSGAYLVTSGVQLYKAKKTLSDEYALNEVCKSKKANASITVSTPAKPVLGLVPLDGSNDQA